jgi:hypothetical protein
MDEQIAIPRCEDEACAQLEGILPEAVLAVAGSLGTMPRFGVLAAEEMEHVPRTQSRSFVSGPFGIDQQRERDAGLLAKQAGIVQVAQSDGSQRGSGLLELVFVFAQLRDMLAAEDSAIVSQEDKYGGLSLPQQAEAHLAAARFGQDQIRQTCTD